MSNITTHVLDTSRGKPGVGIKIFLYFLAEGQWKEAGRGTTNADGRIVSFREGKASYAPGTYKLTFESGRYYELLSTPCFYPYVDIVFTLANTQHNHVPLLLNPYGYSTYRGS